MVIAIDDVLISEFKESLEESRVLFKSICDQYESLKMPSDQPVSLHSNNEDQKLRKLRYMTIAVMCADWESLKGIIWDNDEGLYKEIYEDNKTRYRKWCTKEMQQVGNLRDCIMHHKGNIEIYYKHVRTKEYPSRQIDKTIYPTVESYLEKRKIDKNYVAMRERPDGSVVQMISLREEDMDLFFDSVLTGLDYVSNKIRHLRGG